MKKINKIIAAALSLVTVVGAGSCGGGGGRSSGGGNDGNSEQTTTTSATTTTEAYTVSRDNDEALQEIAENLNVKEEIDVSKMRKLVFMVPWTEYDQTTAGHEIFKANYGIPEEGNDEKYDAKYANEIVVVRKTSDSAQYDDLTLAVQSGDPPDMFDFQLAQFPYTAIKRLFQPIDGIIDMSGSEWDGFREVSEQIEWQGKHYCPVTEIYNFYIWYYRKSVMEELGLEDPYELSKTGEWDWNKLLEYAEVFKNSTTEEGAGFVANGCWVGEDIHASTGIPFIGIENGALVSNLRSDAHARAGEFCEQLRSLGYIDSTCQPLDETPWILGKVLFHSNGLWKMQGVFERYAKKYKWEEGDIGMVFPPKDPKADSYGMVPRVFGYALVSGSDNIETYKAFVQCVLLGNTDPDAKAASREKAKREEGWTDEQYDFWDLTHDPVNNPSKPVMDYKNGVDSQGTQGSTGQRPFDVIINDPLFYGNHTYSEWLDTYENVINSSIAEISEE